MSRQHTLQTVCLVCTWNIMNFLFLHLICVLLNWKYHLGSCFSNELVTGIPHLQYISMVMTDPSLSDANKSLELNALALKYLPDEQLTELAQLTVHRQVRKSEASLLRRVCMFAGYRTFHTTLFLWIVWCCKVAYWLCYTKKMCSYLD